MSPKKNCHRYKFSSNKILLNCPFCTTEEENEFHILFVCPIYEDVRLNTIPSKFMSKRKKKYIVHLNSEQLYFGCKMFDFFIFERERTVGDGESARCVA